ncbi:hypothetical protein ACNKHK_17900 [Shigella flexneri]
MLDEVVARSLMTACTSLHRRTSPAPPAGSTPLDLLTHHSDVGHRRMARKLVDASYRLPTNYRWAIKLKITQKQPNPSRDWSNPNLGT